MDSENLHRRLKKNIGQIQAIDRIRGLDGDRIQVGSETKTTVSL